MKTVNRQFSVYATWRGISDSSAWVFVTVDKPGTVVFVRQWTKVRLGNAARVTKAGQTAWHGGPGGPYVVEVYGDSLGETDQIMTKLLTTLLGPSTVTAALR